MPRSLAAFVRFWLVLFKASMIICFSVIWEMVSIFSLRVDAASGCPVASVLATGSSLTDIRPERFQGELFGFTACYRIENHGF